jgi:hypothetical protein
MDRDLGARIMLVVISSIVVLTRVLWHFEKMRHRRAIRDAFRRTRRRDWSPADEEPIDDPYDVGMNDKDFL